MAGSGGTDARFSFTVFAPIPTESDPVEVVAKPVAAKKGGFSVALVPYRLADTLVAGWADTAPAVPSGIPNGPWDSITFVVKTVGTGLLPGGVKAFPQIAT